MNPLAFDNYRKAAYPERPCGQCLNAEKRINGYSVRFYCERVGRSVGEHYTCDKVR
jgi:hypothetical protein